MFSFPKFKNPFRTASNSSNNTILDKNYISDGTDIKWEDTVEFTFPIKGGRVIKVYDADTITIASKLPFDDSPMYRLSVRLNGIDTPEMKGKGISDEEKEAAKQAQFFVSNMVLNKYVTLENIESENDVSIRINLSDSTTRIWQFGEDGGLTFPEGYLKIVPNGANPYISNIIDNGLGLVSGSAIQIRQSVADAYGISINSSITDTSLGDGSSLASGSNIDVNGSKIILANYTVNYLDANTGQTGQNKI